VIKVCFSRFDAVNKNIIERGDEASGERWSANNVPRKIGNGCNTLFWYEPWLGEKVLKDCFSRFDAVKKNIIERGDEASGERWSANNMPMLEIPTKHITPIKMMNLIWTI